MDTLHSMRLFSEVVDSGSFSAAGRKFGLAASSVSRQVGSLEDTLSARLLNRSTRKLSLTEAGRMPYYLPAQYMDLVGLNSREVAVGGLTVAKIQAFQPDMVFLHHAGAYTPPVSDAAFVRVSREDFLAHHWHPNGASDPVMRAPSLVGDWVRKADRLDAIYFVRYGKGFFHVYLLDSRQVDPAAFERALRLSLSAPVASHCAVSGHWPCARH